MSAIDELSRKFKSGNNVKVSRATFSANEWQQVVEEFDGLHARISELEECIQITPEALECRYNGPCDYKSQNTLNEIKADAIMSAVEEYKREYCGQGIERMLTDYAERVRKGDE